MPYFLRGEIARLVLSYTVEENLVRTTHTFFEECADVPQEIKEVPSDELRECCLVNDRSLTDILREYVGLYNEVKKLAMEHNKADYQKMRFEPPVKILRATVKKILEQDASETTPMDTGQPQRSLEREVRAGPGQLSTGSPKKQESCDRILSKYKRLKPKPLVEMNRMNPESAQITISLPPADTPKKVTPANQPPIIFSIPPDGSIYQLPVLNVSSTDLPVSFSTPVQSMSSVTTSTYSSTRLSTNPNMEDISRSKPSKSAKKSSKEDSDEELLKDLLDGLGMSIAKVIPPSLDQVDKDRIGDMADSCLQDENLLNGLYNLFDSCQQQDIDLDTSLDEANSRISTPSLPAIEYTSQPSEVPQAQESTNQIPQSVLPTSISSPKPEPTRKTAEEKDVQPEQSPPRPCSSSNVPPASTSVINPVQSLPEPSASELETRRQRRKGIPKSNSVSHLKNISPTRNSRERTVSCSEVTSTLTSLIRSSSSPQLRPGNQTQATETSVRDPVQGSSSETGKNPRKISDVSSSSEKSGILSKLVNMSAKNKVESGDKAQNKGKSPCDTQSSLSVFQRRVKSLIRAPSQVLDKPETMNVKTSTESKGQAEDLGTHTTAVEVGRNSPDMILSDLNNDKVFHDSIVEDGVDDKPDENCHTDQQIARNIVRKNGKKIRKRKKMCGKCKGCRQRCGTCQSCKSNPKFGGAGTKYRNVGCFRRICLNYKEDVLIELDVENVIAEEISPTKLKIPAGEVNVATSTPIVSSSGEAGLSVSHVRSLNFSPPKSKGIADREETESDVKLHVVGGLKTLSPTKSVSSPLLSTNSAWTVVHTLFLKDEEDCETEEAGQPAISTDCIPAPGTEISMNTPVVVPSTIVLNLNDAQANLNGPPIALSVLTGVSSCSTTSVTTTTTQNSFKPLSTTVTSTKPKLAQTWDEKMRAGLGDLEKDVSHVTKRAKERAARRKARQKRKISESEEDLDIEDNSNLEGLDPEVKKQIYGIGETLLRDLEKFDKDKEGVENVNPGSVSVSSSSSTQSINQSMPILSSPFKSGMNTSAEDQQSRPLKKRAVRTSSLDSHFLPLSETVVTNVNNSEKEKTVKENLTGTNKPDTTEVSSKQNSSDGHRKRRSSEDRKISANQAGQESSLTGRANQGEVRPSSTVTSETKTEPKLNKTPNSDDRKVSGSGKDKVEVPVTPKKIDSVVFKTPHKSPRFLRSPDRTPRTIRSPTPRILKSPDRTPKTPKTPRHLQTSNLQHLLSPIAGYRRAVALTPKAKKMTPQKMEEEEDRQRHASSLDTPVLDTPDDIPAPYSSTRPPTTPRALGQLGSAPYYTPSPSTRDSQVSPAGSLKDTPGLRYLQEEGERLSSQGEESRSPAKSERRKNCRKNFHNAFQQRKLKSAQVGLLVEKELNYSLSASLAPATPDSNVANYQESPKFFLTRPSSSTTPKGFSSPNRTSYLSPHATMLGFGGSPRRGHTDSESDHLVIANSESEAERERKQVAEGGKRTSAQSEAERERKQVAEGRKRTSAESEEERDKRKMAEERKSTCGGRRKGSALKLSDSADDNAVDDGETLEEVQRAVNLFAKSGNLSDTETFPLAEESRSKSSGKLPIPVFSKSKEIPLSESESEQETDKDPVVEKRTESFISALKETCGKKSKAVKPIEPAKPKADAIKPARRIALVSCARKSPLKNDASSWEEKHDAHCLDKYTSHGLETQGRSARKRHASNKQNPDEDAKKRRLSGNNPPPAVRKTRRTSGKSASETTSSSNSCEPVRVSEQAIHSQGEIHLSFSPRKSKRILAKKQGEMNKSTEEKDNSSYSTEVEKKIGENTEDDIERSSCEDSSSEESEDSSEEEQEDHQNDELSDHEAEVKKTSPGNSKSVAKLLPASKPNSSTSSDEKPDKIEVDSKDAENLPTNVPETDVDSPATKVDTSLIKATFGTVTLTYKKLFVMSN